MTEPDNPLLAALHKQKAKKAAATAKRKARKEAASGEPKPKAEKPKPKYTVASFNNRDKATQPAPTVAAEPLPESWEDLVTDTTEEDLGELMSKRLKKLYKMLSQGDVSHDKLREGFNAVNEVLIDDPTLCTTVMMPEQVGLIFRAAKALTLKATAKGAERATKAEKTKMADALNTKIAALAANGNEDEEL